MLPLRSDAGRQSCIAPSTVRPSLSPGPKTPQGGMVGGENFPLARPHGGDAIVRARLEWECWLRA
eukprot:5590725-Pleurochrysis_carterae.AAC.1